MASHTMRRMVRRLRAVREGSHVERCHAIPHRGGYSNAAHQYGVATLIHLLWPDALDVVVAALYHDTPERWTGDVPSPAVREMPGVRLALTRLEEDIHRELDLPWMHHLSDEGLQKLKAADNLEFLLWAIEEVASGNNNAAPHLQASLGYLTEPGQPDPVPELVEALATDLWRRLPASWADTKKLMMVNEG